MKTTKGALRNMTTGILHTQIGEVYQFIESYTGFDGVMTHHIPAACRALDPILRKKLPAEFFDGGWEKEGLDEEVECPDLTDEEKNEFESGFKSHYEDTWNIIKDKTIVVAK